MHKIGDPHPVIMSDGEGAIKMWIISKWVLKQQIIYFPTKGSPHTVGMMLRKSREMLDKEIQPGQQWTYLIYPTL